MEEELIVNPSPAQILNKNLAVMILLESMLYSYIQDNYENIKEVNPILANICKKDLEILHRNHATFKNRFNPSIELLSDFEELQKLIENFLKI